jgi:hypothetical protein
MKNECNSPEEHRLLLDTFHYDPNTGVFIRKLPSHLAGRVAGSINDQGYVLISFKNQVRRAHRLAWFYMTKRWPSEYLDHIDGVRSNNAFSNLREASPLQNQANMRAHRDSKTGIVGVSFYKRDANWRAYICVAGKIKHLGYFQTIDEAVQARKQAAMEMKGDFARERHEC